MEGTPLLGPAFSGTRSIGFTWLNILFFFKYILECWKKSGCVSTVPNRKNTVICHVHLKMWSSVQKDWNLYCYFKRCYMKMWRFNFTSNIMVWWDNSYILLWDSKNLCIWSFEIKEYCMYFWCSYHWFGKVHDSVACVLCKYNHIRKSNLIFLFIMRPSIGMNYEA